MDTHNPPLHRDAQERPFINESAQANQQQVTITSSLTQIDPNLSTTLSQPPVLIPGSAALVAGRAQGANRRRRQVFLKENNSDDEADQDLRYMEISRSQPPKVCPFSSSERRNPCDSHSTPRKRKDAIQKHLQKVKANGGDSQHPMDDPLWESNLVNWFLSNKPVYDSTKRALGFKNSQSKYYMKRVKLQDVHAEFHRLLFEQGRITEEEYKKVLIGEKRRTFITSQNVKTRLEQSLKAESDKRLEEAIEIRLGELRACEIGDSRSSDNSKAIADLESARNDLFESREKVDGYKELLSIQFAKLVEFYSDDLFLLSKMTFLQYYKFDWPTIATDKEFYRFASVLIPAGDWEDDIKSDSSIRKMKRELIVHISKEKEFVDESEFEILDQVLNVFNACCDIIKMQKDKLTDMSVDGAQA